VSPSPVHLALVMDHPAQQFTRAFQLLAAEPGVRLDVYYWSTAKRFYDADFKRSISWDVDLLSGYQWAAPPVGRSLAGRLFWLAGQLRRPRPDVVICYGWASPIARATIAYCTITRTRMLLYGDTTWQHASGGRHRVLRSLALLALMRLADGALSTGTFNREFYIWHGMNPRRIWPGVCPADTDLFGQARASRIAEAGTRDLRIGFAGKLTASKGVDELLRACALLPGDRSWSLTVVGDGPLMADLQTLAAVLGIDDRVTFRGFANTSEMPKLLAGFDVVVVPSRFDMRVLVSIEAMAAGAAVVVSAATAIWGPGDLVSDGETGLVYRSGDPAALAWQLHRLLDEPGLVARLSAAGAQRAASFGPDSFARVIASSARLCLRDEDIARLGAAEGNHWALAADDPQACRDRCVDELEHRHDAPVGHGLMELDNGASAVAEHARIVQHESRLSSFDIRHEVEFADVCPAQDFPERQCGHWDDRLVRQGRADT
jgi:glycosyltransferase involved in cell wall biosynthesis